MAAPAEAAYTSARLSVVNSSKRVGAGGPVTLSFAQAATDDATARIVTYVPQGYVSSLVPRVGQEVGSGRATLEANGLRSTAAGLLRAADPARYRAHAEACMDSPARLDAVYLLELEEGGRHVLDLPVFVRTITSGAEAAYASGALTVCFPPPGPPILDAPPPRVLSLSLTLRGLLANPTAAGSYRWRSLWTPYRDGIRTANGTVEAQALDLLPAQLTLVTGRYDRLARKLFVGGTLLQNRRPVPGGSLQLLAGRTERGVRRIALARTNANGNYGGRLALRAGTWFLRARAAVRGRTSSGCTVRTVPGVRCLRTTTAGYNVASRIVRVVIPR